MTHDYDIIIIGAGSGGLTVAAVAAQLGLKIALIEGRKMGGDCLNYGCIPSKSILAAAHLVQKARTANQFGVEIPELKVDFKKVHDHVQQVIDTIAVNDSVKRFESLGATVFQQQASFINKHTVQVGDQSLSGKFIVVATGSTPRIFPIPGIEQVDYLTNETIFALTKLPQHLIVLGGGPIGAELSQAFAELGAKVTVIQMPGILPHDNSECVEVVRQQLLKDNITLHEQVLATKIEKNGDNITVFFKGDHTVEQSVTGSHLLVATGQAPAVRGLNLEAAQVEYSERGIQVNKRLRTSQKHIYAIGDVTGGLQFTHAASYQAGVVIKNICFKLPAKVDYRAFPWITYTSPELAHVGMTEDQAKQADETMRVLKRSYAENDRAQAQRETKGFLKAYIGKKGKILGIDIVGSQAGELLLPWVLAMQKGLTIKAFTEVIAPYPTLSEMSKRLAGEYYRESLFSNKTKRLVRFLIKWF